MTAPFGPCAGRPHATRLGALERAIKFTPPRQHIGFHQCPNGHWHADCDCRSLPARIIDAIRRAA